MISFSLQFPESFKAAMGELNCLIYVVEEIEKSVNVVHKCNSLNSQLLYSYKYYEMSRMNDRYVEPLEYF